jgi:hypothetical protein
MLARSAMSSPIPVEPKRFQACHATGAGIGMLCQVGEDGRDRRNGTTQDSPKLVGDRTKDDVALAAAEQAVLCDQVMDRAGRHVGFDFALLSSS